MQDKSLQCIKEISVLITLDHTLLHMITHSIMLGLALVVMRRRIIHILLVVASLSLRCPKKFEFYPLPLLQTSARAMPDPSLFLGDRKGLYRSRKYLSYLRITIPNHRIMLLIILDQYLHTVSQSLSTRGPVKVMRSIPPPLFMRLRIMPNVHIMLLLPCSTTHLQWVRMA